MEQPPLVTQPSAWIIFEPGALTSGLNSSRGLLFPLSLLGPLLEYPAIVSSSLSIVFWSSVAPTVIDKLLDSLIVTKGVTQESLILGDKNAVMVAARILAYGPEYACEVTNPTTGEPVSHTFNLADCPFKKLPEDVKENNFEVDLPISKKKVTFKLLTGKEETIINEELKASKKLGSDVSPELTTRLRHTIISVDGDDSQSTINNFVQNLLARDSMYLRKEIRKVTPDIELQQEIEIEGEPVKVDIPMTVGFFWPDTEG